MKGSIFKKIYDKGKGLFKKKDAQGNDLQTTQEETGPAGKDARETKVQTVKKANGHPHDMTFVENFTHLLSHSEMFPGLKKESDFEKFLVNLLKADKHKPVSSNIEADFYFSEETKNLEESKQNDKHAVLFVGVVGFHHKHGAEIEFLYPEKEKILQLSTGLNEAELEEILKEMTYCALPDGIHLARSDHSYFILQTKKSLLFGVSYFRQILSEIHPEDKDISRSHIQKAVCVISEYALFGNLLAKIEPTTHAYFNQINFKDTQILSDLYLSSNQMKTLGNIDYSEFVSGLSITKVLEYLRTKLITLIKLIMLEARIVVYTQKAGTVTSFILSVLALFPGCSLFRLKDSVQISNYLKSINAFGLPLRIFHSKCRIYTLFNLSDLDHIQGLNGFFLGTTNQLIPTFPKIKADCIINLDTNKFEILNEKLRNSCKANAYDEKFIKGLLKDLEVKKATATEKWSNFERPLSDENFQHNEDFIRREFNSYIKLLISQIALSKKCFLNFESLKLDLGEEFMNTTEAIQEEDDIQPNEIKNENQDEVKTKEVSEKEASKNKKALETKIAEGIKKIGKTEEVEEKKQSKEENVPKKKLEMKRSKSFDPNELKKNKSKIKNFEQEFKKIAEKKKEKAEKKAKKIEKQVKKIDTIRKKAILKLLKNYEWKFLKAWSKTHNFIYWAETFDISVSSMSPNSGETHKNTIHYENGDVYCGSMYDGKKQGEGTLYEFLSHATYNGFWFNDLRHGPGNYSTKNADFIYDGEWIEGKKHGQGKIISKQGMFSGNFVKDQLQGNGVFCDTEGNVYEGEWSEGKQTGMAHYKSHTGEVYAGEFKNGLFHGNGQLTHANGDLYSGSFFEGKKHGNGNIIYSTGSIYEGYWSEDKYNGVGAYKSNEGFQYRGDYVDGELDETKEVSITFPNGDRFVGFSKNKEPYEGMKFLKNGDVEEIMPPKQPDL